MALYSYQCDRECPNCGHDLTDDDAVTVLVGGGPYKTRIASDEDDTFVGFVMDAYATDSTLVLEDDDPVICCSECEERLLFDVLEE